MDASMCARPPVLFFFLRFFFSLLHVEIVSLYPHNKAQRSLWRIRTFIINVSVCWILSVEKNKIKIDEYHTCTICEDTDNWNQCTHFYYKCCMRVCVCVFSSFVTVSERLSGTTTNVFECTLCRLAKTEKCFGFRYVEWFVLHTGGWRCDDAHINTQIDRTLYTGSTINTFKLWCTYIVHEYT